ncbi:MAG: M15 family metallopeptidase, partial [Acidimicrobiia bacterium]|nr:M15 family metallopeptidase [Acidimicrobiia bacterium]
ITSVSSFVARTLRDSHQLSRHSLGTAIDINYSRNPYREDGTLITDMPKWFVDVWKEAGFCWGGDWKTPKDPMHFSWLGPRASGGVSLEPIAPRTSKRLFGSTAAITATVFAAVTDRYQFSIADGTGNGAPDVIGLRPHPNGTVIDIASGNGAFDSCSIFRWFVPDSSFSNADHILFVDVDGDSGQDLVALTADQSGMTAEVATRRTRFQEITTRSTSLDPQLVAVAGADFDGDHQADLWAVSADGTLRVHGGDSWTDLLHEQPLPGGAPQRIAVADRDGGDTPEIFALYPSGSGSKIEVLRLDGGWQVEQSFSITVAPAALMGLGAVDYDGDGRADLQILDSSGQLHAYVGNTSTGRSAQAWFVNPDRECPDDPVKLVYGGTFFDDDSSVHENAIEAIAAEGITKGCNPPFLDMYCPKRTLTRAEAAAFMARALDLPATTTDFFVDDQGNTLEGGINAIAEAGITKGCNPPANDRFCPDRPLTRAEFAAFIARALGLPAATTDYFSDDNGHTLEAAINQLAAAGITRGCNPPTDSWFCPGRLNTRAEAATFLSRALDLGG